MREFWAEAAALVWGQATVALLMGTGIYLSTRVRFTHLRKFYLGWKCALQSAAGKQSGDSDLPGVISPWQSMMTMLCGAIGNGNIAGVATAIAVGGPGAIFWMWACGLFAMAIKYSEAILGLQYREQLAGWLHGRRSHVLPQERRPLALCLPGCSHFWPVWPP